MIYGDAHSVGQSDCGCDHEDHDGDGGWHEDTAGSASRPGAGTGAGPAADQPANQVGHQRGGRQHGNDEEGSSDYDGCRRDEPNVGPRAGGVENRLAHQSPGSVGLAGFTRRTR